MTTQSITSGQERQIVSVVEAAAGSGAKTVLQTLVSLDKDEAQRVLEGGDQVKVAVEVAVASVIRRLVARYPVLTETRLLKPVAQATVPARTKSFNAATFYQTGTGLYVYDTFADRLDLSARPTVDSAPERPYVASLLKANAYDTDIRKELPETHLSTLEDIASLIGAQRSGQSGLLLNNGYANIFYVEGKNGEVFAVNVRWHSGNRYCYVNDLELDEDGLWLAVSQVLCPGNVAL